MMTKHRPRVNSAWILHQATNKCLPLNALCVPPKNQEPPANLNAIGIAGGLYVLDHLFFALAIAIKTYFQKIADPADIASTAGVSFTISHIAAVVLPAAYGLLWLISPALVFLSGAAMAGVSLLLALNVPAHPAPGNEVLIGPRLLPAPAATRASTAPP